MKPQIDENEEGFSPRDIEVLHSIEVKIHPKSTPRRIKYQLSMIDYTGKRSIWKKPFDILQLIRHERLAEPMIILAHYYIRPRNETQKIQFGIFVKERLLEQAHEATMAYLLPLNGQPGNPYYIFPGAV